jgi:DNA replication initiation complex subunit (GINS family)
MLGIPMALKPQVSYSRLVDIFISEITSPYLSDIENGFYEEVKSMIARMREEADRASDLMAEILRREADICEELLLNIARIRALKRIAAGTFDEAPLDEKNAIKGKREEIKVERRRNFVQVMFIKPAPSIVGEDLRIYGPFKKGDVALIPRANAEALEKKGVVEVVE